MKLFEFYPRLGSYSTDGRTTAVRATGRLDTGPAARRSGPARTRVRQL